MSRLINNYDRKIVVPFQALYYFYILFLYTNYIFEVQDDLTHLTSKFEICKVQWTTLLWNNQQMSQCAVKFYFSASPLYMFRAAHTPIIMSTILTVSTAIGTIHSRSQIVSVTSSQRSLARTGYSIEYYDARNNKYQVQ